jgi:hypothetical protein
MQKVVRTACPDRGYWGDKARTDELNMWLEQGYRVVMCNPIHRNDGQQWLEYIIEKPDIYVEEQKSRIADTLGS